MKNRGLGAGFASDVVIEMKLIRKTLMINGMNHMPRQWYIVGLKSFFSNIIKYIESESVTQTSTTQS